MPRRSKPLTRAYSYWRERPPTALEQQQRQTEIDAVRARAEREAAEARDMAGRAGVLPYWRPR